MSTTLHKRRFGQRLATFIAAGFGSGAAPRAPGTAGSVVGLLAGLALWFAWPPLLPAGVLVAVFGGLWAIRVATGLPWRASAPADHDDPGWIVIDEVAGQMLALMGLHRFTWAGVVAAFVLFRLFDIVKPGPVGWADRRGGAGGIMLDDVFAGLLAAAVEGLLF